jgi:uncharacterized protein YcbK (DUF882 family)
MGNRRGQLALLIAALAGLAPPPASASANPILVHLTRTVTGESALLDLNPSSHGTNPRATQSLQRLMRDLTTGQSISPAPELVHFLAELAQAFPSKTISIVHGYADPNRSSSAKSHTQGRALDLRLPDVNCSDIERFLIEHPRLLARVGCFPNATFFHVDVGRSRGIWFDARVGLD